MRITVTIDLDEPTPDAPQNAEMTLSARVFAAVVAYQRQQRSLLTKRGLEQARARGRCGGRPTVWTQQRIDRALQLVREGEEIKAVALEIGVSRASVYRLLANETAVREKAAG